MEASRSNMVNGMEARRRDCAKRREERPAPEIKIGFCVFRAMAILIPILRFEEEDGEFRLKFRSPSRVRRNLEFVEL